MTAEAEALLAQWEMEQGRAFTFRGIPYLESIQVERVMDERRLRALFVEKARRAL